MKRTKRDGKAAVVAVGVLGAFALVGGLAWYFELLPESNSGPDRTELVRQFLVRALSDSASSLEILSCKQVHAKTIEEARKQYPTFEVVNCTFRNKDALGNVVNQTHHFWILDGKIILTLGFPFDKTRSQKDVEDLIAKNKNFDPEASQRAGESRMKMQIGAAAKKSEEKDSKKGEDKKSKAEEKDGTKGEDKIKKPQ